MNDQPAVIVARDQAWFRPFVQADALLPFPVEEVNTYTWTGSGEFHAKFLLGKGPFTANLPPRPQLYFEHGEEEYPVCRSLMEGPTGAGVFLRTEPRELRFAENEGAFLIQVSVAQLVDDEHVETVRKALAEQREGDTDPVLCELRQLRNRLHESMEKLVGAYALYQPSFVWERAATWQKLALLDQSQQKPLFERLGIHAPILLNPSPRLHGTSMRDGVTANMQAILETDLLLPFRFLAESVTQSEPAMRLLNYFWILEQLSRKRCGSLPEQASVRVEYNCIEQALEESGSSFLPAFKSWKHRILNKDLIETIGEYHQAIGISFDQDLCKHSLRLRNLISHAKPYDKPQMLSCEPRLGSLVRQCLRRELKLSGIVLDVGAAAS